MKLTGTEIGALWKDGDDLYVGWKDGSTYGIDVVDQDNKAPAVYESLEMDVKRPEIEKIIKFLKMVAKQPVPEGCSVAIKYKTTRENDDWVDTDREDGSEEMSEGDVTGIFNTEGQGEIFQIRVELTPSGNDTPEISGIFAFLNLADD